MGSFWIFRIPYFIILFCELQFGQRGSGSSKSSNVVARCLVLGLIDFFLGIRFSIID